MNFLERFKTDRNYAVGLALFGVFILVIILSAYLAVQIYTAFSGGNEEYPTKTVTVTGSGEVVAVPDIATFDFSLLVTADDVAKAQEEMSKKVNEAIDFLKSNGIEEADIKTTSFNANPRYEYTICRDSYCPDNGQKIIGYDVSQNVMVKVRDIARAGEFLKGITDKGITNVSGLQFSIDDPSALEVEARTLAIEDARKKADKLASDLGVKIKGVVSFGEDNYGGGPMYYGSAEAKSSDGFGGGVVPNLPVGESVVTSNVYVTYEIK